MGPCLSGVHWPETGKTNVKIAVAFGMGFHPYPDRLRRYPELEQVK
jgi:hypothetical protein